MMKINGFTYFFAFSLSIVSLISNAQEVITLAELKSQLAVLQKKIIQLEKQQVMTTDSLEKATHSREEIARNTAATLTDSTNSVKVYTTLRPTIGYIDENDHTQADVRDALSHAGIKVSSDFAMDWRATLHGEWGIDLANNGDFGKARQVYVALDSPLGRVGIGKQRPAQYLFIAEYVDIFNHGSSPFAYDAESIFFVNNLVTYQVKNGGYTWMAAAQFDGDNGDHYSDLLNLGISYDHQGLHAAFTYLSQDANSNGASMGDDETYAAALAYDFDSGLYLALAYQDKTYQRTLAQADRTGHTFDFSAAYWLSKSYRVKLGYFDFSDGFNANQSQDFSGFNTTLEWIPKPYLRFHLEYLQRDFDYLANFSSLSIGFRYDFSTQWLY